MGVLGFLAELGGPALEVIGAFTLALGALETSVTLVKSALDPHDVLNPGKKIPARQPSGSSTASNEAA